MNPVDWKPDKTPKSFYNPLKDDFKISYRDDENILTDYIIPSLKISTFPTYMADYFIKHIIDEMINERELGYVTPEMQKELEAEVAV